MLLLLIFQLSAIIALVCGEDNGDNNSISRPVLHAIDVPSSGKKNISMEFYLKAHSYITKTKIHRDYTLQETIDHVDGAVNWEAPQELQEKFPYYLSGYGWDDQPGAAGMYIQMVRYVVWIGEIGKYNVREQIERGPEATHNLTKYLYQGFFNILQRYTAFIAFGSIHDKDIPGKETRGAFFIGDMAGFDVSQAAHVPTIQYAFHQLITYGDILGPWVAGAVGVNGNKMHGDNVVLVSYLATVLFQSVRPFLGGVLERIEFFGTNKVKWQAALQKMLPPEAIPTWYGGSKDYKPVKIFGR